MSDMMLDGRKIGEVREIIIDRRGLRGERLLAVRETGQSTVSGEVTAYFDLLPPHALIVTRAWFYRLARASMTRRGFRRWRGRRRARARS